MAEITLNALSVAFELLIYHVFFQYFFKKAHFSKKYMVFIYMLVGAISLYVSVCISDKFVHRLSYYGVVMLLAFCYEGQLFIKVFIPFVFQSISIMVENCFGLILVPLKLAMEIYGEIGYHFYYFIGITLSNLTILFLVKLFCTWKDYVFIKKNDLTFPLYFPVLFLFPMCIMFIIDQYSLAVAHMGKIDVMTIIPVVLLMAIAVVFFFLFDGILHNIQAKQKIEIIQKQLEHEMAYHKTLLEKHQQFMQLRHDMRDDFELISSLIKNEAYQEALYFSQQKSGKLAATSVFHTGNSMLDTILTIKMEEARQLHTDFQSYVVGELNDLEVAAEDLASLCANVLNNALEAVGKIADEKGRCIWVQLVQKDNFLYLMVRNTTADTIEIKENALKSTKEDTKLHGLGLDIIKTIVEKYHGNYSLNWENYIFSIKILLYNAEETNK